MQNNIFKTFAVLLVFLIFCFLPISISCADYDELFKDIDDSSDFSYSEKSDVYFEYFGSSGLQKHAEAEIVNKKPESEEWIKFDEEANCYWNLGDELIESEKGKIIQNGVKHFVFDDDLSLSPYSSVGFLLSVDTKVGWMLRGTGVLIGLDYVLTAAHLVYDPNFNDTQTEFSAKLISFYPAFNANSPQPKGGITGKTVILFKSYLSAEVSEEKKKFIDIALIKLSKPYEGGNYLSIPKIKKRTMSSGFLSRSKKTTVIRNVLGYPGTLKGYMMISGVNVQKEEKKEGSTLIKYKIRGVPLVKGQSGGPIIKEKMIKEKKGKEEVELSLLGIHTGVDTRTQTGQGISFVNSPMNAVITKWQEILK